MEQRILWGLIGILAAGVVWMLWPFMDAIVLGIFFAYVLYFLEDALESYIESQRVAKAAILSFLVVSILALAYGVTSSITFVSSNIESFFTSFSSSASFIVEVFNLPEAFGTVIERMVVDLNENIRSALLAEVRSIPTLLINLFIFGLTTFYFFRNGESIRSALYHVIEDMKGYRGDVALTFARNTEDIFREIYIEKTVIGLVMLLLSGFGYYALGVEFWWAWAILTAMFGFLPIVGAPIIYVPLGVLYMALGDFWLGVVLIIYGVVVVNTLVELFLVPRFGKPDYTEESGLLFIGFISGPIVLGPKGIILGPAILILTRKFLVEFYRRDDR